MRILSTSMRHISSTERKSLHGRSISRMYLEKAIQHVHTHDKFKVDKAWHCRKSSSQTQYINEIRELRGTRSDEREREILLSSSEVNMTHETKNITFHVIHVKVSSDCRCSRTLSMNVAIESVLCGCEKHLCKDWAWSKLCGKHGKKWSKAEHCIKVWYSHSQTCLGQSVHNRPLLSLVPQRPVSHRNARKQWFQWQTTRWALACIDVYGFPVPQRIWLCS